MTPHHDAAKKITSCAGMLLSVAFSVFTLSAQSSSSELSCFFEIESRRFVTRCILKYSSDLFLQVPAVAADEIPPPPAIRKPSRDVVKEKEDKLRAEMQELDNKIKVSCLTLPRTPLSETEKLPEM